MITNFKKAKGVPKKTLKRALDFENYRKTLQENECKQIAPLGHTNTKYTT